jgi:ankyrin repeat protein
MAENYREWQKNLKTNQHQESFDYLDAAKNTPIHFACYFSNHRAIKILLDKGLCYDVSNHEGLTPF